MFRQVQIFQSLDNELLMSPCFCLSHGFFIANWVVHVFLCIDKYEVDWKFTWGPLILQRLQYSVGQIIFPRTFISQWVALKIVLPKDCHCSPCKMLAMISIIYRCLKIHQLIEKWDQNVYNNCFLKKKTLAIFSRHWMSLTASFLPTYKVWDSSNQSKKIWEAVQIDS